MQTAKTLIKLGDAQADLSLHWAHSHFVGFVVLQLKLFFNHNKRAERDKPANQTSLILDVLFGYKNWDFNQTNLHKTLVYALNLLYLTPLKSEK